MLLTMKKSKYLYIIFSPNWSSEASPNPPLHCLNVYIQTYVYLTHILFIVFVPRGVKQGETDFVPQSREIVEWTCPRVKSQRTILTYIIESKAIQKISNSH